MAGVGLNGSGQAGGGGDNAFYITPVSYQTGKVRISNIGAVRLGGYGAGTLSTDASGNVTASSDERLKNDIQPFRGGIEGIEPISYNWSETSGYDTSIRYVGFSAQNVQASIPEAVGCNPDGNLTLNHTAIIAALVNTVNELEARLTKLEAKPENN